MQQVQPINILTTIQNIKPNHPQLGANYCLIGDDAGVRNIKTITMSGTQEHGWVQDIGPV